MGMPAKPAGTNLAVLMPVYEDWTCARIVVQRLDHALGGVNAVTRVLILDDGSRSSPDEPFVDFPTTSLQRVEVLRLRRNLGHQRAIAVGLTYLYSKTDYDAIVVMDADGEDDPAQVVPLLSHFQASKQKKVVFAARARRSEGWAFTIFYHSYRLIHWLLTGIPVRVGNFSVLGNAQLSTLVVVPDLWNHYAASVLKARLPFEMVPLPRGKRLGGKSQLNFIGLVTHGLSAISVFAEVVGVRMTLAIGTLVALSLALVGCVLAVRLGTSLAIPGWATSAVGFLLVLMLQMLTVALGLTLATLFSRNTLSFLPIRDFHFFIGEVRKLYERE